MRICDRKKLRCTVKYFLSSCACCVKMTVVKIIERHLPKNEKGAMVVFTALFTCMRTLKFKAQPLRFILPWISGRNKGCEFQ